MSNPFSPALIVICGPTATGKSAQALRLAQRLGSPLLGADSRQIYRDFDIGTAKPTPAERQAWPHHLIDFVDPRLPYTVAQYQAEAQALIAAAQAEGRIPIVVGGTGLYLQAITQGLGIPAVPPQPDLRRQLQSLPQPLLHAFLRQVDPDSRIHANDAVRTQRALEIFYVTGRAPSSLPKAAPPRYALLQIGLICPMEALRQRIRIRTQDMLAQGWIEEVRTLQAKYGPDLPLLRTLGYAEIADFLRGQIASADLPEAIVRATRQFAKRQITWFRHVEGICWLDCQDPDLPARIEELVHHFVKALAKPSPAPDNESNRP